jgi:tol-pal system protein YbgF
MMMVNTSVKYIVAIAVVLVSVAVPLAGYGAIGAEPSNKPTDNTYAVPDPTMQAASDPGMYPGINRGFPQSAPLMMQPPTGTMQPSTGMMMPPASGMVTQPLYGSMMQPPTGMMQPPTGMMQPPASGMMTQPLYGSMMQPSGTMSPYFPYNESQPYGSMPGGTYLPYNESQLYGSMPGGTYLPYPYEMPQGSSGPYQSPWYQPIPGSPYPSQPNYGSTDLQIYNQAMQAYRNRDYWTAMAKFQEVATLYPQSDLADNAYYWTGEIYYVGKNFPAAVQAFQTVLYSYPNGNKVPDAHVKMGFAYAEVRQYEIARSILNEVVARYSTNSRIRNLAMKKLNELNNVY